MNYDAEAGLLTYSRLSSLPIRIGRKVTDYGYRYGEHSSGTVRDSNPIPF